MWVWIVIGVVALAAALYALWPRAGGIDDAAAMRGRQNAHGALERDHNTNRDNFPL